MRWASAPELFDPPDQELLEAIMLVKTAKWMGVAPWDLAEQPIWWLDLASLAVELEADKRAGNQKANA
jgi:hypothetical protein